jgi:hypothetical protein
MTKTTVYLIATQHRQNPLGLCCVAKTQKTRPHWDTAKCTTLNTDESSTNVFTRTYNKIQSKQTWQPTVVALLYL